MGNAWIICDFKRNAEILNCSENGQIFNSIKGKYLYTIINKFSNFYNEIISMQSLYYVLDLAAARSKRILAPSVSLIDTLTGWTMVTYKNRQHVVKSWRRIRLQLNIGPVVCDMGVYCLRRMKNSQETPILSRTAWAIMV